MGKRKSRAKPPPKNQMDRLDKVFSCPFCNHGTGVECHMYIKAYLCDKTDLFRLGKIMLLLTFVLRFHGRASSALSEPINAYCKWMNKCEHVNGTTDDDDVDS